MTEAQNHAKVVPLPGARIDGVGASAVVRAAAQMEAYCALIRSKYNGLLKAGFTEDQAIRLCQKL